jgi:hypothetical protein
MTRGPEQRELDRLSRSNERLESELAKCNLALEIQRKHQIRAVLERLLAESEDPRRGRD